MAGRNTTASVVQSSTIRCRVERQVDRPSIRLTQPRQPRQASSAGCLGLAGGDQPAVAQCDSPARCCSALQESERDRRPSHADLAAPPLRVCLVSLRQRASCQVVWSRLAVSFSPPRSMRGLRSVRWPSPTGFFVAGEGRGRWATLGMRETESRSIQADGHDGEGKHSFNRGMTPAICPDRGGGPSVPNFPFPAPRKRSSSPPGSHSSRVLFRLGFHCLVSSSTGRSALWQLWWGIVLFSVDGWRQLKVMTRNGRHMETWTGVQFGACVFCLFQDCIAACTLSIRRVQSPPHCIHWSQVSRTP